VSLSLDRRNKFVVKTLNCRKLAKALVLRADTQKCIEQLRERLKISALIQEGDEPPENPQTLLEELDRLFGQLETLISAINRTNIQVVLPNGKTVTEARRYAQKNQMMILTANRNMKGEDSLEQVMREENTADSFPILTITDIDRLDEFDYRE
jgi:hypothetical protein